MDKIHFLVKVYVSMPLVMKCQMLRLQDIELVHLFGHFLQEFDPAGNIYFLHNLFVNRFSDITHYTMQQI